MQSVNVCQSVAFWEYVGTVKNLVEKFSAVAYNRLVSKPTGLPYDQPASSADMLERWLAGEFWET
jgi:hypothetical protein